jgi:hypothetical protein
MNTCLKPSKNQIVSHNTSKGMAANKPHKLTSDFIKCCSCSLVLSLVGLIVNAGSWSAQAETIDSLETASPMAQLSQAPENNSTSAIASDETTVDYAAIEMIPESTASRSANAGTMAEAFTSADSLESVRLTTEPQSDGISNEAPAANMVNHSPTETATPNTSSVDLAPVDNTPGRLAQESADPDTSNVSPGRATRSGSSYIGVGGNIGLGEGDTALGDSSFAVFGKVGLTSNLSVRPTVLIEDDPTILLPLTLDFTFGATDVTEDVSEDIGFRVNPFVGAGIAISTGDDSAVDLLVSGGIDVPITSRFTGTASVNATFFDNIAVGLLLGVGYNF